MTDLETGRNRRRTPDLFTMATGVGALGVSGVALFGGVTWLPEISVRWVLVAAALLLSLVLVVGSFLPRR
jgi:hypothetical protein